MSLEERLIDLESHIADLQKTVDDLNTELIRQSKIMAQLEKDHKTFKTVLSENPIKPQSEETPPPHY